MGKHVGEYMETLVEEDPETFAKKFSKYVEEGIDGEGMEELIASVHAAIRADPTPAPKKAYKSPAQYKRAAKRTLEDRRTAVADKKQARLQSLLAARAGGAAADDEEDEDN